MRQLDTRSREIPKIAEAVHLLTRTRWGEVTLTAGTTTTVTDPTVTPDTLYFFDPVTMNADTALRAGPLYVLAADRLLGSFTITHSAGTTDCIFRWLAAGD
jgi:hypothetical protein